MELQIKNIIAELELQQLDTIPGVKTLQPWATWIFYRGKTEEIRSYPNKKLVLTAILASGWDNYFNKKETIAELPYPYEHFCIIGFVRLVGITHYQDAHTFNSNYESHFNPPNFFDGECFGWQLEDITPIRPIYYEHGVLPLF
ncbi:unnamed protein product [marine sediment metagenome]|uniref:ASCH domain-containing protein n=1 Tax=marine sediment metagenome TaxID=412755 RepID=X1I653_9ZZZZ